MKIKEWKYWFEPLILSRGLSYAKNGNVEDVEIHKDGTISATVYGSDEYEVEIETENGEIVDMDCTCPYSQDGNYCKHEAAVLYSVTSENGSMDYSLEDFEDEDDEYEEYEEGDVFPTFRKDRPAFNANFKPSDSELKALIDLIAGLDANEARRALLALVTKDKGAFEFLSDWYDLKPEISKEDSIREEIDNASSFYEDEEFFIDSYNARGYCSRLMDILDRYVPDLITGNQRIEAFGIVLHAMEAMCEEDMDDSNGEIWEMGEVVKDYWKQIVEKATDSEEHSMLEILEAQERDENAHDYLKEVVFDFMHSGFRHKTTQNEILKKELSYLEEYKSQKKSDRFERAADFVALALCDEKTSGRKLLEFVDSYGQYGKVAEIIINHFHRKKDVDREYLLLYRIYSDKKHSYSLSRSEVARRIAGILSAGRDKEEAKQFYRNSILHECYVSDVSEFRVLKDLDTEEEWKADKKRIYEIYRPAKYGNVILQLMLDENDVDMVFAAFDDSSGNVGEMAFDLLKNDLINKDPERTFALERRFLNGSLTMSQNRNYYRRICMELRNIRKIYPDGKRYSQELADEWKSRYKKRTALLDELAKAGF